MVEPKQSTQAPEHFHTFEYAKWRMDKEPSPGYSRELINCKVPEEFYDNLEGMEFEDSQFHTLLQVFRRNVRMLGDEPFLGTRETLTPAGPDQKPQFGEYQWRSYNEVAQIVENFARGLAVLDLCPWVEGEGQQWKFIAVWSKNCLEWTTTVLAAMHY